MATKAAEAVVKRAPFQVGKNQVFLPPYVISMLPPKRVFSPYFATFQVPLRFNKLDLRDYLFHAYGVEVRAVRSWVTPQKAYRKYNDPDQYADPQTGKISNKDVVDGASTRWVTPMPIKRMMVELVQPFVFPKPPDRLPDSKLFAKDAPPLGERNPDDPRDAWDYAMFRRQKLEAGSAFKEVKERRRDLKFPLHEERKHVPSFRVALAKQAQELVQGERQWRSEAQVDAERYAALVEAEEAERARKAEGQAKRR